MAKKKFTVVLTVLIGLSGGLSLLQVRPTASSSAKLWITAEVNVLHLTNQVVQYYQGIRVIYDFARELQRLQEKEHASKPELGPAIHDCSIRLSTSCNKGVIQRPRVAAPRQHAVRADPLSSSAPVAEGSLAVQPCLHVRHAHQMIPFVEAGLGAHATGVHLSPEGKVLNATIEIPGATLEMDEAQRDVHADPPDLHVYVLDKDALYAQLVDAGAEGTNAGQAAPGVRPLRY